MSDVVCYQESGLFGARLVRPIDETSHLVPYQMSMMTRCRPEWAIPSFLRYHEGQAQVCHNLNGLKSLDCVYYAGNLTCRNGILLLSEIIDHLINAEDFLMPIDQISLHPSHIFCPDDTMTPNRFQLIFWPVALQNPDPMAVIEALASIASTFNLPEKMIQNLRNAYAEGGLQNLKSALTALKNDNAQINAKDARSNLIGLLANLGQSVKNRWHERRESVIDRLRHAMQLVSQWLHYQVQEDQLPDNQTVLMPADPANFRMAMISAGKPGTPAENEGVRAYILVDEFLLGRDIKACDLCLGESGIGRQHARIQRRSGSFYITDLGSRNGTRLDGKRLLKNVETLLPDQCLLQFADQSYYFQAD